MMKNELITAIILVLLAPGQLTAQGLGEPAPDFEVNLIEPDTTFTLSDHQGKVVFIYFFGNGCPYCKSSGPDIESSIYQVFKDNETFAAVGIDTWDTSSSPTSVASFRNVTGISFPLALKGGAVAASFQTTYDRLLVVDTEGIIVHKGVLVAGVDIENAVAAINASLSATGIQDATGLPAVKVYPNPASEKLHISAGGAPIAGITLYDITGKQIINEVYPNAPLSSDVNLSVQGLVQGIYFYTIRSNGLLHTGKVLIRR